MMGLIFYLHLVRAINGRAFEPSRLTKMMRKRPPGRPAPPWYQCWVRRGTAAFELFWTLKWEGARGWDGMSWLPTSCFSSLKMHGEHCFLSYLKVQKLCRRSGGGKKLNPPCGEGVPRGQLNLRKRTIFYIPVGHPNFVTKSQLRHENRVCGQLIRSNSSMGELLKHSIRFSNSSMLAQSQPAHSSQ